MEPPKKKRGRPAKNRIPVAIYLDPKVNRDLRSDMKKNGRGLSDSVNHLLRAALDV